MSNDDDTKPIRLAEPESSAETFNRFGVAAHADQIVILAWTSDSVAGAARVLSKAEALNLAAWLVALADEGGAFDRLYAKILAT